MLRIQLLVLAVVALVAIHLYDPDPGPDDDLVRSSVCDLCQNLCMLNQE